MANIKTSKPPVKPIVSVFVLTALALIIAIYLLQTYGYVGLIIGVIIGIPIELFALIIYIPSLPSNDFPGKLMEIKDAVDTYHNELLPVIDLFYAVEPELLNYVTQNNGQIIDAITRDAPELLPAIRKLLIAIANSKRNTSTPSK
ncbi:hypothetical protein [Metallibacterium scheffleri]|jgi:uncharacterized membrane-anchored protein YhcB (DUF1043 family)|uniref:hypothetical protein n=1 Tax=Metallibacterium scheffleri TaxID=993689 RepID=UPI0023F1A52D|nr:hypothetical protein [Metallibacterium scheffleri]